MASEVHSKFLLPPFLGQLLYYCFCYTLLSNGQTRRLPIIINYSTLIVNLLTMLSYRTPQGTNYSRATCDQLLPASSMPPALTTSTLRNPRGITCCYATRDLLLLILSKPSALIVNRSTLIVNHHLRHFATYKLIYATFFQKSNKNKRV